MDTNELYKRLDEGERQVFDILFDYSQIEGLKEFVKRMEEKYGKEK